MFRDLLPTTDIRGFGFHGSLPPPTTAFLLTSLRGAWKLSLDLFVHLIEMRHGLPDIGHSEQPGGEGVIATTGERGVHTV